MECDVGVDMHSKASVFAKRGYKMATIAVADRLARITFAMLRDGTDFDVGQLNVEEGPFERTVVRSTTRWTPFVPPCRCWRRSGASAMRRARN